MQTITDLEELDRMLAECERAAQISDDDLRRVFQLYRMDVSAQLPPDPFSAEYADAQMALYERISGRSYSTRNEESIIDINSAVLRPFPYNASCQVAGAHLGAIGFLFGSLQLRPGARVLDVGAGWGNTTLGLARLGYEVTALDIEARFCELIRQRARRIELQIEVINDDFFWIEKARRRFDAIVFFESFHHCADHPRLLRSLGPALVPGGHVYFGAEPITPHFPVPWGLRTDGESLWAIRRNGWLELGFHPDYFRHALQRAGFSAEMRTSTDLPWINVWDAKIDSPKLPEIAISASKLVHQTAVPASESTPLPVASDGGIGQADKNRAQPRQPEANSPSQIRRRLTRLRKIGDRLTGGGVRALLRRLLSGSPAGTKNLPPDQGSDQDCFPLDIPVSRSELPSAQATEFIVDVYRALLQRDPDQVGLRDFQNRLRTGSLDRVGLINTILSSTEFNSRLAGGAKPQPDEPRGCLRSEAESLFKHFPKYNGSGRPGFVTNFIGGLTDVRFVHGIDSLSGIVEGYPIPGNFHGDTLEWIGTLRSALDARDTFTMLELGAGWAPWCVIAYLAAKQCGIEKIKVIGVEGDAGHIRFIREHFATNDIDPGVGEAIHGVVGIEDGEATFPKANSANRVYGGCPAFSKAEQERGAFADFAASQSALVEEFERLPCFSLATLMRDFDEVDLIHCDIQGSEAGLFASTIDLVSAKVKRLVVGTHSFEIDRSLVNLFLKKGWILESFDACAFKEEGKPVLVRDGTQIWRNERF
jgi:2-polyprenyl-3-methyl-5-hydroxy-6-metoxy-1,4-benzoquinol methylase